MLSDRAKELEATLKHLRELIDSPTPIETEKSQTSPDVNNRLPKPRTRANRQKSPPVLTKVVQYNLAGVPEWKKSRQKPTPEAEKTERFFHDLAEELASVVLKTMARNINEPPSVASRRLKQDIQQTLLEAVSDMKDYFAEQDARQASIPIFGGDAKHANRYDGPKR